MLDNQVKEQLKNYLAKLVNPIEIVASINDTEKSREMTALLQDIAELSTKITLIEKADDDRRSPSFSINRPDGGVNLRFAGIPMGHEFTSLVLALLQVGGYPPKVEPDVIEQIKNLDGKYEFETYISLSCQNCPEVVQALNLMAVLNPNISHVMIDGSIYQDEVNERHIMAVPSIYMNGQEFGQGRMNIKEILAKVDTGSSRREAEKYILAGRVKVNGKIVKELGTKVGEKAFILVDGKPIKREKKAYYLFYKPRGVVTTMTDPQGRRTVADFAKDLPERVFPVGRLDYNTEGLLLLTNDGDLAQKLTHPKHEVNKTYRVTVPGLVPQDKLDLLRIGVKLEDGMTAPAIVTLIGYDNEKSNTTFDIVIHEGRNRQVRRMCDFIGFPVRQLKRIKLGNLTLQGLKRGGYRILNEDEINALIKAAAINE